MSLINEMLKDLEDRKVKGAYDQKEILSGVQASDSESVSTRAWILVIIAFLIIAALVFYAVSYLRVAPQPLAEERAILEGNMQTDVSPEVVQTEKAGISNPEVIRVIREGNDFFLIELSGRAATTNLQQAPGKAVLSISGATVSAIEMPQGWTVVSKDGNAVLSIPVSKTQQLSIKDSGSLENQVIRLKLVARPKLVAKQKVKPVLRAPTPEITREVETGTAAESSQSSPVIKKVVPLSEKQKAEAAYRRANTALEGGELAAARQALSESIGFKPQAKAYIALAGVHMKMDEYASARQVLKQSQRSLPGNADIAILYSRLLLDVQQYDAAFAAMRSALSAAEGRSDYLVQYAAIAQKLNRYDVAIDSYVKALTINQAQPNAWMGLAISLEANDQNSEALQAYYTALAKGLNDSLQPYVMQRIQILEGEGS
jgi:Tfp pilus assembly protein PilF/large-conductance mechanosensitive channel